MLQGRFPRDYRLSTGRFNEGIGGARAGVCSGCVESEEQSTRGRSQASEQSCFQHSQGHESPIKKTINFCLRFVTDQRKNSLNPHLKNPYKHAGTELFAAGLAAQESWTFRPGQPQVSGRHDHRRHRRERWQAARRRFKGQPSIEAPGSWTVGLAPCLGECRSLKTRIGAMLAACQALVSVQRPARLATVLPAQG